MQVRTRGLLQLSAIAGAVVAWLGWFEIAPALGFPTTGPAAMLNRIFLPRSDPGVWLGWILVTLGLIAVAGLFAVATARGWLRSGVLSGLLVGLVAWAISGMVLMVIIGHVSQPPPAPPPPPGPPLPTTPDPMHATFLMLHLGVGAPIGALAAWLLFGAVIGAASAPTEDENLEAAARSPHTPPIGPVVAASVVCATVMVSGLIAGPRATAAGGQVEIRTLATGPAKAMPDGDAFVSVLELPQAPGAKLGPHAHVPGFAFVLRGRETITFPGQDRLELEPDEGGFMGALAIHTHENRRRGPAALLGLGLLAIALTIAVVSIVRRDGRRTMATLSVLLILAGALAIWDPWVNDWLFVSVRPEAARGGLMPLPNAARIYESPVLRGMSGGPYTETLRLITVPAGGRFTIDQEAGPETFVVLSGEGTIAMDGASVPLSESRGALAQQGTSVRVSNPTREGLSVLSFIVVGTG